ncbi:ATP-binding protein [Paraburkholderia acidisoli]|uniref:histidine kinase n=1 Tax=Paraburkholderia acidisoli TaxID=2571748 RepID=A0A7Z2GK14_9BURK|nr:ATP-binding protein [Paraburkholderia acidisoli]QGZ63240.1 response regulator [Paraburkholderia acidisoli]
MFRAHRLDALTQRSPADAVAALERSLRRERRVFTMLTALLIFAALCMAAVALGSIGFGMLQAQALRVRETSAQLDKLLDRRKALLTGAATVLAAQQASSTDDHAAAAPQPLCTPLSAELDTSPDLRRSCERAAQLAARIDDDEPLLYLRLDGSAAYGSQLATDARVLADSNARVADAAHLLVDAALLRMTSRGADPVSAAHDVRVTWFRAPPGSGVPLDVVYGALNVLKDGKPYALVITSVDPAALARASSPDTGTPFATLFDADNAVLDSPLPAARAQALDQRVARLVAGSYHVIPSFGWVRRVPPLDYDFGHYMVAISWPDGLALMRTPLLLVLSLTAALVAMLIALTRYWNRQVLERTYDEAARALEGELLNHLLVHATPVGLCIVKRSNFEIVVANQIVRNVLGLDATATRLPTALCAAFETQPGWPDVVTREHATPVYELPFSLTRQDPESIHLAITYAPATMNREDVMFCAVTDMSKHYEVERLLREAKRLSDEAARAKVSFFAAMSHEIRTPLASLVGNIELVARGPLAPEQGARVQAMEISAAELLQIVSDVLDFSKIDVGQMKLTETPGSIAALLVRIALAHAPLAVRQRLPFYLVMDRAIPAQRQFDSIRVAQIVNNLLSNAFKFTHSGKIVLRARWRDDTLVLGVSDSGGGIPDDLKPQLFQPFTQGDAHRLTQARGTGLGLTICARLAALMQGRIELDSTQGVGTRVTVTLPLRHVEDVETDADEPSAGEAWTLPDAHPALLCRAPENREWLANLYDTRTSTPTFLTPGETPREDGHDYLLVTDEFTRDEVRTLWPDSAKIVWLRQDGPLVPIVRDDGSVEVSLYSLTGIRAATRMIARDGRATRDNNADSPAGTSRVAAIADEHFAALTVLIAEDNLLNRGLLRDQLRTLGAHTVEAKDGEEALARLEDRHVDLVLTDINMPVMNGFELLAAARERYPDLRIYGLSSNALPEHIEEGRALGFTDYLSKPVALADLARVLAATAAIVVPAQHHEESVALDSDDEPPRFPTLTPALAPLFVEQAERDLDDYAEIARLRDWARLSDWAHRVSGGVAVLGPSMLNEACLELRATMREAGAWTDDVSDLAAAVAEELEAFRTLAAQRDAV